MKQRVQFSLHVSTIQVIWECSPDLDWFCVSVAFVRKKC